VVSFNGNTWFSVNEPALCQDQLVITGSEYTTGSVNSGMANICVQVNCLNS